jgi:hypothetical protein
MNERLGTLYALYKVFRWVALVVLVLVAFAALRRPVAVAPESTPETVQSRAHDFDAKLQHLADVHSRGEAGEARFTAEEVNAAISRTMQESPESATSAPAPTSESAQNPSSAEPATPGTQEARRPSAPCRWLFKAVK